jgi:hypothetical protein
MTAPEQDVVRVFSLALTPAARSHLHLDYATITALRTACQTTTPRDLAKTVSNGIGWHTPANAPALIAWRIRRAAGQTDPQHHDTEETNA